MDRLSHLVYDYLVAHNVTHSIAIYLNLIALIIVVSIIVFCIDYVIRKLLLTTFTKFAKRSKSKFDDILIANKVSRNIAHIIPLYLSIKALPYVLTDFHNTIEIFIAKSLQVIGVILVLWVVRSVLNALKDFFKTLPRFKDKPIDSYIQVFMIFAWIVGFIFTIVVVNNVEWKVFFATIGGATAIIILIFRDTILGFVASIQVSINDMVRIGDWITMEKYGADGDVTEINLSTVKVQNFDKTITTIPTYALISDSFRNWRGMVNSNGRRIKRALHIKLESIKYLTKDDLSNLKDIEIISNYLSQRETDINNYNTANNINKKVLLNGRNLTNIGVFRKYIETYLKSHSAINKEMMIMARQLAPTTQGVPLEIYAFSKDKRWENYEYIMSDIFDHLISAVPYFNLELFEQPNSSSFLST